MSVSGLGYLALNVTNMKEWLEIATGIFSMEVLQRADSEAVDLRIDDYHHRFTLYPAAEDSIAAVGWETKSLADLEDLVGRLRDYGVEVTKGTDALKEERKVIELYQFIDPASGTPSELFYAPQREMYPFKPTRGIDGYKTGDLGLGHVVYVVRDYEESKKFYERVLGFKLSDYIIWDDKDATFYHCNARHHSLAIMKPFGDFKGGEFNHVMIEAKSVNDIGYAYDVAREMQLPLIMEMGRHTNDHVQSFYIVTPSGFGIEYGYGGLLIDENWSVRSYDSPRLWGHHSPEEE
ncbi:VOC family protein [Emcibacter nanhaiensis]|uniref:2,3-dihydroxybiphenyl 1,2-dioxygenase n=1 Tax=Emcibacter nanhaiensis TaxID=1505037 RepID=A0A501PI62_9PROT|nr:VOC family protein [Emcibacter nanhaiensis]TPD60173.1 2,3-dihydroxybiphenyl 1,2-dioxygenase [Emcibacter nanhaiensis]